MLITLNSKKYVTVDGTSEENLVNPISDPVRFTGSTRRRDNTEVESTVYNDWANKGVFWNHQRQDDGRGVGGLFKSTAETRFDESIYQQILEEAQTHSGVADHLVRYMNFKGDFFGIFEEEYAAGAINTAVTRKFNAGTDTWDDTASANDPTFASDSTGAATGGSITVSHTAQSTYGYRIAVATLSQYDASGGGLGTVSAATYGGTAMTLLTTVTGGTAVKLSIYYLIDPPVAASDCTFSVSVDDELLLHVADYYYVDQLKPFREGGGTGASSAQTLAREADVHDDDLVIGGFAHRPATGGSGAITPGTGQTETSEFNNGSSSPELATSYEQAGGRSATFDHSYTTSAGNGNCAIVFGVLAAPNGVISIGDSNAVGVRMFDACFHKGRMWVVGSRGEAREQTYGIWSSADGATFVSHEGSNWPSTSLLSTTVTRRNNFNDDMARLFDDGDMLWAFVWDDVNNEVEVLTTVDEGTTWVAEFQIPSVDGPKGAIRWFTRQGSSSVLLGLAEGIYSVNAADNEYTLELGSDGQVANNRWMVVGDDGNLYTPLAEDDVLQVSLGGKVAEGIYAWEASRIGPLSAHDGVPAVWRGHANYLMSGNSIGGQASRWLWVLFGGHAASKTATVLCYDYERSRDQGSPVWHCFHDAQENSISGIAQNVDFTMMGLSSESDATPRAHVTAEGTAASIMFHFDEPLISHQVVGIAGKYQTTSYVEFAIDDHGDPNLTGTLVQAGITAYGLDTTSNDNEKVVWNYGLENGDWDDVSPGTLYSDKLNITLGSGAGVAAKESMHEITLTRRSGTNTKRIDVREFEVLWRKNYATLESHVLVIDLHKSAEVEDSVKNGDTEQVITNLKAARDLTTLPAFVLGGSGTLYVKVSNLRFKYSHLDQGDGRGGVGKRGGRATLTVGQVVPA